MSLRVTFWRHFKFSSWWGFYPSIFYKNHVHSKLEPEEPSHLSISLLLTFYSFTVSFFVSPLELVLTPYNYPPDLGLRVLTQTYSSPRSLLFAFGNSTPETEMKFSIIIKLWNSFYFEQIQNLYKQLLHNLR